MEGYDIVLIGSLFGQPAFQQKYGQPTSASSTGYQVRTPWQVGLGNATNVGAFIGAMFNGWLTDRFGYRRVLMGSLLLVCCFIFITFFAPSVQVLLVGELLTSLPWGVFATSAPAYAAEVCPLALRGHLTIYVDLCWALGQLVAAGVLDGVANMSSQWAYRIPFGVQWAWPLPICICVLFAPETPWWLVRRDRLDQARRSVERLSTKDPQHVTEQMAMIAHTVSLEMEISRGSSYLDCFRGTDLRRTEIACLTFAAQCMCGLMLGGNPTYFFEQAGVPSSNAFKLTVGTLGLSCIGVFIALYLITYYGRRTLYIGGLALLSGLQFIVGIVSAASHGTGSNYTQAGLIMLWLFLFYITIGPVCFPIISEISSSRLRVQTVCLARNSYYIASIVAGIINPYMLNPTAGDWKGKTAFFWGGSCAVCCLWAYFRLPETKDRTYEELDLLFAAKIPARDFSKYHVDAYNQDRQLIRKR
jgi:SP family general alpha glucoside:H+ symporter-like MFS transporter